MYADRHGNRGYSGQARRCWLARTEIISGSLIARVCVCVCVHMCTHIHICALLCPTLCNPTDCSLPGSSVHGILQARKVEWVAISSSSRGSSQPRDQTCISWVSCIGRRILYCWATWQALSNEGPPAKILTIPTVCFQQTASASQRAC